KGQGSKFSVRLPLLYLKLVSNDPALSDSVDENTLLSCHRILIVDDNQDAAAMLGMLLRNLGQEVKEANDGPTAIHLVPEFRPDVVLLDIGMPGMDGYQVAQ